MGIKGGGFCVLKLFIKREGEGKDNIIAPGIITIGPFSIYLSTAVYRCTEHPIFVCPIIFFGVLNGIISFFYQFHIYISGYVTYRLWPHLRCDQITPRRPLLSITGNNGQIIPKISSDGLYILYTCIMRYVHTLI